MNNLIFVITGTLLFSCSSFAKFDLSVGTQGRTLPALGAELYADAGYGQVLWGEREAGDKNVLFGLIRPSLGVSTSAVINSVKAEIEVFPISFLGLAIGRQFIHSNFDFPFFDCDQVTCQGEFTRNYVETKIALGARGWVTLLSYKFDTLRASKKSRPIADWRHVIVGEPGEEVQIERKALIAKMMGHHMVGLLLENVRFEGSGEMKESYAAVYQYKPAEVAYMIGAGSFRTSREPTGLIFYFRVNANLIPSLKLF
ncbi:MAG: hypothetical protein ACOVP4_13025 [Bacteriovoracaceae bacterium]